MPRIDAIRAEILRLMQSRPFRKFVLNLENGDRVLIEHPENIALDPDAEPATSEFYVITGKLRLFSTFGAISSVVLADRGGQAA